MTRPFVNTVSMWVVAAVLALTPLALGGNRPLVWPMVLLALAAVLIFKSIVLFWIDAKPAVSLATFKFEVVLILSFLVFAAFQPLPLVSLSNMDTWGLPSGGALSIAPTESFLALMTWLNVVIVAYLSLQLTRNEQRSLEFMSILFWIVVVHAALGFVLFHEFDDATLIGPKWAYLGSMTGAFVNRNTFATFLASGAVLGTVLLLRDLRNFYSSTRALSNVARPLFKLVGLLLVIAVLFGTGSRMGVFVGIMGVVLAMALILPKQMSGGGSRFKAFALVIPVFGILLLVMLGFGNQTVERLGSIDRDTDVRLALYQQTWTMIMDRPWTGFGGGTYELAFPLFHQPDVSVDLLWQKAHSSYLGLWSDYGLLFGTLPWLVLVILIVRLAKNIWMRPAPDYAAVSALVVAVIAMLHALVDFSLEIQGYALLFAAIIGTGASRISASMRNTP